MATYTWIGNANRYVDSSDIVYETRGSDGTWFKVNVVRLGPATPAAAHKELLRERLTMNSYGYYMLVYENSTKGWHCGRLQRDEVAQLGDNYTFSPERDLIVAQEEAARRGELAAKLQADFVGISNKLLEANSKIQELEAQIEKLRKAGEMVAVAAPGTVESVLKERGRTGYHCKTKNGSAIWTDCNFVAGPQGELIVHDKHLENSWHNGDWSSGRPLNLYARFGSVWDVIMWSDGTVFREDLTKTPSGIKILGKP